MKVAVLYTGALRTIQKTMRYFKQNVLLHGDVHVFACVQNDTATVPGEWEAWIREEMGEHLRSLTWFDLAQHPEWMMIREQNLATTHLPEGWLKYLRTSGSIIEYMQMFMAYRTMLDYERVHGYSYDSIVRMRTDVVCAKPIDFHWLQWDEARIEERLHAVKECMVANDLPCEPFRVLDAFMNTLLDDALLPNLKQIRGESVQGKHLVIPDTAAEYRRYLHEGSYILTYRGNIFYIVRRDFFCLIPCLAGMYGLLPPPVPNDYWFNAESQFRNVCYYSGLTTHDYCTTLDGSSICEYDEKKYFDADYRILHSFIVFCLVRY